MFPHFYKDVLGLFLLFSILFLTISCGRNGAEKGIEYEICEKTEIPDELFSMIEEKKGEPFRLVYKNSAYMYLVEGFGDQNHRENAAALRKIEESEKKIYVEFILVGRLNPEKLRAGEPSDQPYLVIRLEKNGKEVLFQ